MIGCIYIGPVPPTKQLLIPLICFEDALLTRLLPMGKMKVVGGGGSNFNGG